MIDEGFPIEWQGETYYASPLTKAIKDQFVKWLGQKLLVRASLLCDGDDLSDEERTVLFARYKMIESEVLTNGVHWTATTSPHVAMAIGQPEGSRYLAKLILDDAAKAMSKEAFHAMIDAKLADTSSDWHRVLNTIWGTADPKAKSGSPASAAPTADNG